MVHATSGPRTKLDRDAIVHAALALLEREGTDSMTGASVARFLGVTQPAIYRHIDSIDEIWRGLGLVGRMRLAEALTTAAVGRSGADAVVAVAAAWRSFALENAALYAATDRYPCSADPELEAAVEQVVDVLAMAMRGYGLDDETSMVAARMLRSFLHGFVHLELGDGHPHPVDNDASFERIVSLLSTVLPSLVAPCEEDAP